MSNTGKGGRAPWPSVGDLHTTVRDAFKARGWGTTTLSKVEADHPTLMKTPATRESMGQLVGIENKRATSGSLQTKGDALAFFATPFRGAAVHGAMANASLGRYGMKGLVEDKHGYGMETFRQIVDGNF